MKRLWLIVLLCLLPLPSLAAPATPYDPALVLGYGKLSRSQQQLADLLYRAAAACEETVALPPGTAYADADAVMRYVIDDFPELAGLDRQYRIAWYQNRPEEAVSITLRYTRAPERRAELLGRAGRMAEAAQDGPPFERECALHDMLCDQTAYRPEGLSPHDAWGALCLGEAVCDGYAQGLVLLLRLAGIPASVVSGTAAGPDGAWSAHAWVYASIGGTRCLTDVTWNDQPDGILPFYFNLSAAETEQNHRSESLFDTADAAGDAQWHRMRDCFAQDAEAARAILLRQRALGAETLHLRVPPPLLQTVCAALPDWLDAPLVFFADSAQGCLLVRLQAASF